MDKQDERGWVVVGALFATLFLIWGPINAGGVFFIPVIKHFGWSRGFFSLLVGIAPLAAGLSSPAVGWLMDRIGVRQMMIAGASTVALGYMALSRANSAAEFLVVLFILGIGVTASTIIPTALVITNWFQENRGLALGVAFAGIPLGGTGVTIFANYVVLHYGFRAGYFAMGVPIALIVVPLLAAFVRTRPDEHAGDSELATAGATAVPGLELSEALRSRSFWLIAIAEVLFATASLGVQVHLVPYLTGIGYAPTVAAGLFAAMFIFSAIGSFVIGSMADSRGGRVMLTAVFVAAAAGIAALLGAPRFAAVVACIVVFGFVRETHLLPLVINESLGVRRLGSILGLLALFTTFGFAAGPAIAGRIFDVTGSYTGAWIMFIAMGLVSALAMRATRELADEEARIAVGKVLPLNPGQEQGSAAAP
ncbi:MFS transporter [Candidatus Binatus sp.]|uniref:MFS transporter n=1 Tax=Candidatus Binatus sp. TaxID=2811406 RepID=UPI003CC663E2